MKDEFAPNVVVRSACWPIGALADLGSAELARLALSTNEGDPVAWAGYEASYEHAVEETRTRLWDRTCGDPRFMRALVVSNPAFAQLTLRIARGARRTKRVRHAETSLYRYLARAVGRTQPCDLWTGVALARWGEVTAVIPAAPIHGFAPDLRPFQSMLRALASTSEYREAGCWKTNVTLAQRQGGGWTFWGRDGLSAIEPRELAPSPGVDAVLCLLRGLPAQPLAALVEHLCEHATIDEETARLFLLNLVRNGALVGGVDLPSRFDSPWEALHAATTMLHGAHREAWRHGYESLREICQRLARLESLTASDVLREFDLAAATIRAIASGLGLPPPEPPRAPLRCDTVVPFEITLGPALLASAKAAFDEYRRFQSGYALGHGLRNAERRKMVLSTVRRPLTELPLLDAGTDGSAPPLTWEDYTASTGADAELTLRLERWRRLLDDPNATVTSLGEDDVPAPPFGCFMFGYGDRGLCIHGVVDEMAPVYSRYAHLWAGPDRRATDDLGHWYRAQVRRVASESDVAIVELVTPCEVNPNALARPSFTDATLGIWLADPAEAPLPSPELFLDPVSDSLLLHRDASRPDERPLAVFSFASANVAWGDPVCQGLLATSFRVARLTHLRADTVPFAHELTTARPSPRVCLPETGALVRARRKVVTGEALTELRNASPAVRFARWCRLVKECGWTRIVSARRDEDPAMLLPVDSPVAIEALFEGAATTRLLLIEEAPDEFWMDDGHGNKYLAEFAFPFVRGRHCWSNRKQRSRVVAGERTAAPSRQRCSAER